MKPEIIKENSTHKAVKENNRIAIYIKGIDLEELHYPDEFLYSIPLENEDDLFAIFERYDEDNRINMAQFEAEMSTI